MKNKTLSLAIMGILGLFVLATTANAELVIKTTATNQAPVVKKVETTETKTPVETTVTKTVTTSPTTVAPPVVSTPVVVADPKVSGFGNDIPLDQALEQMLPSNDWKITWIGTESDVSRLKNEKVSWNETNATLDNAVNKVASKAKNACASIDYKLKTISVKPLTTTKTVETTTTTVSVASVPVHPHPMTPTTPVEVMPVAVHPMVEAWRLDPTLSLKQNIMAWAKKADYTVVWEGSDYKIYGNTVFTGAFDSEDGPVMTVLSAYEHSDQPLKASMTVRDRVLFVHNKNWDMPTVIPINSNDDIAPDIHGHDAPAHIPDITKEAAKSYDPYTASSNGGGVSVSGH